MFKIKAECQDCGFDSSRGTVPPSQRMHPATELPGETRIMTEKEACVCVCVCVCSVPVSPHRARSFPGLLRSRDLVFFRFGVIHSVFTNLLLWANSVLNESKHQLNEHKERLITLGFGNITIGEWWEAPCHPGRTSWKPPGTRAVRDEGAGSEEPQRPSGSALTRQSSVVEGL